MNIIYKTYVKTLLILFCIPFFTSNAFCQIKLNEEKVKDFANEVFLNCNQYSTEEYLDLYKQDIYRIEIYKTAELENQKIVINNIYSLALKNKCNSALQYDNAQNFVPENFNPLKYFFPKSANPLYYNISGTDYIIKVDVK